MTQYDVNLREYWRIVRKRKSIVLVIAVLVGIFSTAFAILSAPAPLYSTVCTIEIKRERFVEGIYSKTIEWDDSDDIETQIAVIKSYVVFARVAEHMGLIPRNSSAKADHQLKSDVIATIEGLQSKVEISRVKYSSILNIKTTDPSAAFAQRLANTVALVYRELHGEQQTKRVKETLRYIDDQMKEVRAKLVDAEDRFNRFSKDNELISVDLQSETLLKQTKEIQGELAKLEEEKAEGDALLTRLRDFIRNPVGAGQNFDSIKANSRYQSANDHLVGLLLKRESLLKEFTPKHPEVIAISNEISETARKMDFMLDLQAAGQEKKQTDLYKELEKIDRKTKALLDKKLEYGRLKREVELYTEMTTLLERKNQEALIRRSEKPEEVNVVKPALLPTSCINPPRTAATGAMGVLIGIVLGLIIAFVVETFDTSLGAIEDVEQTLGLPVLGVIPHVDLKITQENIQERYPGRIKEHALKQAVNLISHFVPRSMMAESFRSLRTSIRFKDTAKEMRTLAIVSTSPQEGKTLIALNLAITMAQSGMKTLLVGSDLRKPVVARVFGVPSSPGLSEILLGTSEWRETVRGVTDLLLGEFSLDEVIISPGLDNLFFIPGGAVPPNPSDLIESQALQWFIEEAKNEYDMILFDTAPILSTADSAVLGAKVDGVLLVYRIGTVPKGLLKRSITQLMQVKANVIGVILNGMRPEVSPDFEEYKHYSYYYSNGEDGKKRRKTKNLFVAETRGLTPSDLDESGAEKEEQQGWSQPKNKLGLLLAALASVLLAGGILWQTHKTDLPIPNTTGNLVQKEEMIIPAKEQGAIDLDLEKPSVSAVQEYQPANALETGRSTPEATRIEPLKAETNLPSVPEGTNAVLAGPTEEELHPPASIPATSHSAVTYPFSLWLCTMPQVREAERRISKYIKKGLPAYYSEVALRGGIRYRLYTGYFETKEQAESFKQEKGLKDAEVKETPFSNLIGTFTTAEELEDRIESLKRVGLSPYVIKDADGKQRLLVGAFHSEERAKRQYEELKSKGLENQIVLR